MKKHRVLTTTQAAEFLNVSRSFLDKDRINQKSIPFMRIGRKIAYDINDLEAFMEQQKKAAMGED